MARRNPWPKRIVLALAAAAATAGIFVSLKPAPIPVQLARAVRGPLVVTVDASAKTRWVDKRTLSAPVMGYLSKISLRPGDVFQAGQLLAEILPSVSTPLDARAKAEATARLGSVRASLSEAQRLVEKSEVALELAEKETARSRQLVDAQALSPQAFDIALAELRARRADYELAKSTIDRLRSEQSLVLASLSDPAKGVKASTQRMELRAEGPGTVLRIHNESAGPVTPGAPLLDMGASDSLEIVVELPTQSAMRVAPGAHVRVDSLGNGMLLSGKVKLVEPSAFTKVTALGVEEQRVNVIVLPAPEQREWPRLGDGFALDVHIEVQKAESVVKVPLGAVFRHATGSAVFAVHDGQVHLMTVQVGSRSNEEAEITNGLAENAAVVVHPSDKLKDKARVVVE